MGDHFAARTPQGSRAGRGRGRRAPDASHLQPPTSAWLMCGAWETRRAVGGRGAIGGWRLLSLLSDHCPCPAPSWCREGNRPEKAGLAPKPGRHGGPGAFLHGGSPIPSQQTPYRGLISLRGLERGKGPCACALSPPLSRPGKAAFLFLVKSHITWASLLPNRFPWDPRRKQAAGACRQAESLGAGSCLPTKALGLKPHLGPQPYVVAPPASLGLNDHHAHPTGVDLRTDTASRLAQDPEPTKGQASRMSSGH